MGLFDNSNTYANRKEQIQHQMQAAQEKNNQWKAQNAAKSEAAWAAAKEEERRRERVHEGSSGSSGKGKVSGVANVKTKTPSQNTNIKQVMQQVGSNPNGKGLSNAFTSGSLNDIIDYSQPTPQSQPKRETGGNLTTPSNYKGSDSNSGSSASQYTKPVTTTQPEVPETQEQDATQQYIDALMKRSQAMDTANGLTPSGAQETEEQIVQPVSNYMPYGDPRQRAKESPASTNVAVPEEDSAEYKRWLREQNAQANAEAANDQWANVVDEGSALGGTNFTGNGYVPTNLLYSENFDTISPYDPVYTLYDWNGQPREVGIDFNNEIYDRPLETVTPREITPNSAIENDYYYQLGIENGLTPVEAKEYASEQHEREGTTPVFDTFGDLLDYYGDQGRERLDEAEEAIADRNENLNVPGNPYLGNPDTAVDRYLEGSGPERDAKLKAFYRDARNSFEAADRRNDLAQDYINAVLAQDGKTRADYTNAEWAELEQQASAYATENGPETEKADWEYLLNQGQERWDRDTAAQEAVAEQVENLRNQPPSGYMPYGDPRQNQNVPTTGGGEQTQPAQRSYYYPATSGGYDQSVVDYMNNNGAGSTSANQNNGGILDSIVDFFTPNNDYTPETDEQKRERLERLNEQYRTDGTLNYQPETAEEKRERLARESEQLQSGNTGSGSSNKKIGGVMSGNGGKNSGSGMVEGTPGYNADGTPNDVLKSMMNGDWNIDMGIGGADTNSLGNVIQHEGDAERILHTFDTANGFTGFTVPKGYEKYIANDQYTSSGNLDDLVYGENGVMDTANRQNVQMVDATDEQYAEALNAIINANPVLQDLITSGQITPSDIARHFMKANESIAQANNDGIPDYYDYENYPELARNSVDPTASRGGTGGTTGTPTGVRITDYYPSYEQGGVVAKAPYKVGGYTDSELEAMGNNPYTDPYGYKAYEGYYQAPDGAWYPVDQQKAEYYMRYGTYRGWEEPMRDYFNTFGTFYGYSPTWRKTGRNFGGGGSRRGYGGGGNSSSYSSSYGYGSNGYTGGSNNDVQPELTNQTRQRINNIMRNWTF